jgi:hypothetical protein
MIGAAGALGQTPNESGFAAANVANQLQRLAAL